jgi:hypothetical protein
MATTAEQDLAPDQAEHADTTTKPPTAPADPVREPATEREYAVYEVVDYNDKVAAAEDLRLVALVTSDSKAAARWAAVDASPELRARVTAKDGKSGEEVYLLPIALRALAGAEATFEEVQQVTARR